MINSNLTRDNAAQEKTHLLKTLTKAQAVVREHLPATDNLPTHVSLRKLAKEKISMLRHNLELVVDRCQTLIETCQQAEKSRYNPETQSSVVSTCDLECLIVEAMAVHLHTEDLTERTLALWVSPSTLTQLVRRSNPTKPFTEPRYKTDDWLYEYELFYKGDRLFTFRDLFWPFSGSRGMCKNIESTRSGGIAIPSYCYEELISLRNSSRINWYEELSLLFPHKQRSSNLGATDPNDRVSSRDISVARNDIDPSLSSQRADSDVDHSSPGDHHAILKDLHLHKISDCKYLLTCDGFSIQLNEACLKDILHQVKGPTIDARSNTLNINNSLIQIRADLEVTLLVDQKQRRSLYNEGQQLLNKQAKSNT